METLIKPMSDLLISYKFLGFHRAILNWYLCSDPEKKLYRTRKKRKTVSKIETDIASLSQSLKECLDEEEMIELVRECDFLEVTQRLSKECYLERRYRPTNVFFNREALYNLTNVVIPEDIQMGLSFGHKFLFPYACTNKNMCEILAQLDLTIEQSIPDLKQLGATLEICNILRKQSRIQNDYNKVWLSFVLFRTKDFLFQNKNLFATRSDKGGHTVVLSLEQYNEKLSEMLGDESYKSVQSSPLARLVEKETRFIDKFKNDQKINRLVKHLSLYEPRTLLLSKFYGLIKVHKTGHPLRPITAMTGSVGYLVGKVFNKMLNEVFPTTGFHIKDSFRFVNFITHTKIKSNDRLVSFDVVSMFTSIPIHLVKRIILGRSNVFFEKYSLNRADLYAILNFLLIECTFFTAQDKIFKQTKGLPMGSCISPTLARIVMDEVVHTLLIAVPEISFIKVFVDDTIAAMNPKLIDRALNVLNGFMPGQIRFTKEIENENGSINFLNLSLTRRTVFSSSLEAEYIIITRWYRKYFASGRLLNYFSSHKRTTILATAIHFIKTVLFLSNSCFYNENREKVIQTLRDNSFPETLIIALMNQYYTYMKPLYRFDEPLSLYENTDLPFSFYCNFNEKYQQCKKPREVASTDHKVVIHSSQEENKFVIFPHAISGSREIKRIIHRDKMSNRTLAESVKNTKINVIRTIKTRTPLIARGNVILISKCKCGDKVRILMTGLNETGLHAMNKIINKKTSCDIFSHAYTKIKVRRGLFYSNQTKCFLKYLHWKYRHKIDTKFKYEFPTSKLVRLI